MAKPRPAFGECARCGGTFPMNRKGMPRRYCDLCSSGGRRNPDNKHKSAAQLDAEGAIRRFEREHPGQPVPDELLEALNDVPPIRALDGDPLPPRDHAAAVAADQQAAMVAWGQGHLQPPDGPIVLNTPVGDYDPERDRLLEPPARLAVDESLEPAEAPPPEPEPDEDIEVPEVAAVCLAPHCEIPRPRYGHDQFCRNDWQVIPLDLRHRLLDAPAGTGERHRATIACIRAVRRAVSGR